MSNLKEDWIKNLSTKNERMAYGKYGAFSVTTNIFEAPDEIRNDKEMCLIALLDADEFIWNIPLHMHTIEFYKELHQKGYKHNLLAFKSVWEEEDFDFVKDYAQTILNKEEKLKFSIMLSYKGLFANREMVLDLVKNNLFPDKEFILKHYKTDKEMVSLLLDKNPNLIKSVMKTIKNHYCKNFENIYKILKSDPDNYLYLPEKIKEKSEVIELVLSMSPDLLNRLPESIINDKEHLISLIHKFESIKGSHIPYQYRYDYDIATIMIKRNGVNFKNFNFKDDDFLIRLSTKTYKSFQYIPATKEYEDLIIQVFEDGIQENLEKFLNNNKSARHFQFIKERVVQLVQENKIDEKTLSKYLEESLVIDLNRDVLIECMKYCPSIYAVCTKDLLKTDIELAYHYLISHENTGSDKFLNVGSKIINEASKSGLSVKNYITNEYLKLNLSLKENKKTGVFKI